MHVEFRITDPALPPTWWTELQRDLGGKEVVKVRVPREYGWPGWSTFWCLGKRYTAAMAVFARILDSARSHGIEVGALAPDIAPSRQGSASADTLPPADLDRATEESLEADRRPPSPEVSLHRQTR